MMTEDWAVGLCDLFNEHYVTLMYNTYFPHSEWDPFDSQADRSRYWNGSHS